MRKVMVAALLLVAGSVMAQTFTDVDTTQHQGKTGLKSLIEDIDANFAVIEGGAYNVSYKPATGAGTMTITGNETNDASVILDADDGDDNADTWTIKSATADNNLDLINHTTEAANLAADGTFSVLGGVDAIGAVDLDIGSADVLDVTVVTDGGTIILDGEATIDGKYAVVGPNATTGQMVLSAAITSTAATLQTNSFATAFGAAPVVVCTYTEDPGDVRPIFVTSVTASNFICSVTADKNFSYIAVGQRP